MLTLKISSLKNLPHTKPVIRHPILALSLVLLLTVCSTDEPIPTAGPESLDAPAATLSLRTLSTQPWLVSGGDVLFEVEAPGLSNPGQLQVMLGETDITSQLVKVADTQWQALIDGLPEGDSVLTASLMGTAQSQTLTLTNYPISGPMISGPHQSHIPVPERRISTGQRRTPG